MRKMNPHAFDKLHKEYKESGLSVHDFCSNQDIVVSSFYYWQRKFKKSSEVSDREFIPLVIEGPSKCITPVAAKEVSKANHLEFIFPNGTKLVLKENIDLNLLKTIVHLYD
jgi:hypothetical protein